PAVAGHFSGSRAVRDGWDAAASACPGQSAAKEVLRPPIAETHFAHPHREISAGRTTAAAVNFHVDVTPTSKQQAKIEKMEGRMLQLRPWWKRRLAVKYGLEADPHSGPAIRTLHRAAIVASAALAAVSQARIGNASTV